MQILVKNMILGDDDHLFLMDTLAKDYIDNIACDGCDDGMETISVIQNSEGDVGLVTGLCKSCGYIKRIKNLSQERYNTHFSEKWLVKRDEDVVENIYVYNKLKPYISKSGKVLDIGCGLGGSLLPFNKLGYEVFGVEPSKHRSAKAQVIMHNIETDTSENYLSNTNQCFDVIFIYNVLQFLENPFYVLEMAVDKLKDDGYLYLRVGSFSHKSNYCQFSHNGIIKNNLTLYSLKSLLKKLNIFPVYYKSEPFELILSKKETEDSRKILSSAVKVDIKMVEKYAEKTLNYNRLVVFGKTSIYYNGRKTSISLRRPAGKILPVVFEHVSGPDKVPLLLK
jgi:SAM-dependent methyltransferase